MATIGILGSGNVGGRLGEALTRAGHTVRYGGRGADAIQAAVRDAEVVILAVPFQAVDEVLAQAGSLAGKVLVDATNPIARDAAGLSVAPLPEGSGAEHVAARAPGARVVKAFNTAGAEHIQAPGATGRPVDLFFAGDDAQARATVEGLARDIGFHPVDCGPLRNARLLEHLAVLWIHLAMAGGHGREVVFGLLGSKKG